MHDRGFRVLIGGSPLPCRRWAGAVRPSANDDEAGCDQYLSSFVEQEEQQLHLVVLIQDTEDYRPHEERIAQGLRELLDGLPRTSRVAMAHFGSRPPASISFETAQRQTIVRTEPYDEGDFRLLDSIRAAQAALLRLGTDAGPGRPPPRRVIAVLADGRDLVASPRSFADLGDELLQHEVALFPIAYSARGEVLPLLGLGEIAARSQGTLRWAQHEDELSTRFSSLARELAQSSIVIVRGPALAEQLATPGAAPTIDVSVACCVQHADGTLSEQCTKSLRSLSLPREAASSIPPSWPWRLGLLLLLLAGVVAGGLRLRKKA